ncbi:MAG: hypothetical protein MUF73_13575 [Rhodobacteraceae bacterium]|jgi:hypothetical protein|nr:hypothetical protein [Paracoccaceae bacterium]
MPLADLPWLWCHGAIPADAPDGPRHRAVGPDASTLAQAAADLATDRLVVVVPPDIRPWPVARGLSVPTGLLALVAAGVRTVLWPAEDAITATIRADQGIWLASAVTIGQAAPALVAGTAADTLQPVVPPMVAARCDGATTPEAAFRDGHAAMTAAGPSRDAGLGLLASLGADHPHGDWWGLGAARALLGEEVEAAWTDETARSGEIDALRSSPAARRLELAREVRVRTGLAVHPLSAQAAAAVRAMRSSVAPPGIWDRHATDLAAVLPDGSAAPEVHGVRLARTLAWGVG